MFNKPGDYLARRGFLKTLVGAGSLMACAPLHQAHGAVVPRPGRLKQAVCRGVFRGLKLDLDGMCREAARLGVTGFDLQGPDAFPTLKKYGLVPTMVGGGSGIKRGINDPANHRDIDARMREAIKAAAAAGAPNVIVMAGSREKISDDEGLENSVNFLNGIKALAEDEGVTLCLELLNSKVNHPGYMGDHTVWGVEMCKRTHLE
jgi:hydroxypyruvate isomerase